MKCVPCGALGEVEYENHLDWKVRGDSRALFGQIKWKLMPHLFESKP